MAQAPIKANFKPYMGSDPKKRAKSERDWERAAKIAECANRMVANHPAEVQTIFFHEIAQKVGCTEAQVLAAIGDGGSTHIRVGVPPEARKLLAAYKVEP